MPSFDVVTEVETHELMNAVDQLNREISHRVDFKCTDPKMTLTDNAINFEHTMDIQLQQKRDIMVNKLSKRGIDTACLDRGKVEERGLRAYQTITVKHGIDKDSAKKITKLIKEKKFKVQAAIQGEQVRVTGKKRDDLQAVMAFLRESDVGVPLQFNNFRD